MNNNIRTDLALEMHELLKQETASNNYIEGVEIFNQEDNDIKITRVKILTEAGEKQIGKPIGNYITIETPKIQEQDPEIKKRLCDRLSQELKPLIHVGDNENILIIGLGNKDITPDSLGPLVVSKLLVTRHLLEYMPDSIDEGVRPVCAVATGVLGTTGIETFEIVQGIVDKVKPKLVIVIDALAARNVSRIGTTIQIADTGISPGSGVGNKRKEISKNTLNIPVISIGVPTVIDKNTMVSDLVELVLDKFSENIDANKRQQILEQTLNNQNNNLMVTPKEIDSLIQRVSKIIANGLNLSLHEGITLEYVDKYIS